MQPCGLHSLQSFCEHVVSYFSGRGIGTSQCSIKLFNFGSIAGLEVRRGSGKCWDVYGMVDQSCYRVRVKVMSQ